jgi:hypothetical protein
VSGQYSTRFNKELARLSHVQKNSFSGDGILICASGLRTTHDALGLVKAKV